MKSRRQTAQQRDRGESPAIGIKPGQKHILKSKDNVFEQKCYLEHCAFWPFRRLWVEDKTCEVGWFFEDLSSPSSRERFSCEVCRTTGLSASSFSPQLTRPATVRSTTIVSVLNMTTSLWLVCWWENKTLKSFIASFKQNMTTQRDCVHDSSSGIVGMEWKELLSSSYKEKLHVASLWWARTCDVFNGTSKTVYQQKMKNKVNFKVYPSVVFSIFALLYKHDRYLTPEHSHRPKRNPLPINSPNFPLLPSPGN